MAAGDSKFDRLPKTLSGVRNFNASKGILLFLIGALLYVGRSAFIPVALSLLSGLILSSPVEALHRKGVPRGLSAALILVLVLAACSGLVALTWTPAQQWYASAPRTLNTIQRKITPIAHLMGHIQELTDRAGAVGASGRAPAPGVAAASQEYASRAVLQTLRDRTVGLATIIILTLFLLAGGPPMVARMTAAFFDHLKANHVLRLIERVRGEVGQFYVTTTLINLALGVATVLLMFAWRMPTPYLWGAVATVFNYVPYVGAVTTLVLLTFAAIVSFDGLGHAVGVALSYASISAILGQIVQPWLIGRRLEVNPLLIFLGLWFGGMFWGVAGVVLATPVLVALKVIAEHRPDGQSMLTFLGPAKASEPPLREPKTPSLREPKA